MCLNQNVTDFGVSPQAKTVFVYFVANLFSFLPISKLSKGPLRSGMVKIAFICRPDFFSSQELVQGIKATIRADLQVFIVTKNNTYALYLILYIDCYVTQLNTVLNFPLPTSNNILTELCNDVDANVVETKYFSLPVGL